MTKNFMNSGTETVTINLAVYEELKNFHKAFSDGKKVVLKAHTSYGHDNSYYILTSDEAVMEAFKYLEEYKKSYREMWDELKALKEKR